MLVPASGLVTALEPVLVAARYVGAPDREARIARWWMRATGCSTARFAELYITTVWLTDEEVDGYYEGF